jgi:hypothetical protein
VERQRERVGPRLDHEPLIPHVTSSAGLDQTLSEKCGRWDRNRTAANLDKL